MEIKVNTMQPSIEMPMVLDEHGEKRYVVSQRLRSGVSVLEVRVKIIRVRD